MAKVILTPGKLYARMSREFARLRPHACDSCIMPMVYSVGRRYGDCANWLVEDLTLGCEICKPVVADIVRRFSFLYDIFDPTTMTAGSPSSAFQPPEPRPPIF